MTKDMSGIDVVYDDVTLRPFRAWGGVWHDAPSGHPASSEGAIYDSPSMLEGV